MFDWIGDALSWVGDKISGAVSGVGSAISEAVWDVMLEWVFNTLYAAIAEFFGKINGMAAEIFDLSWVNAFLSLFSAFGWALFAAGLVVAVFDTAIEYQTVAQIYKVPVLMFLKDLWQSVCLRICPLLCISFVLRYRRRFLMI